ncbi:hypothetical protein [Nocardia salmonicida]|uniref:hypothetical protein n=1 Tax=Nocardia salmonicida TaxID=53431 RepID=UPI002E2CF646|nr:hypothetical protein [Nocardia salmonicida]
MKPFVGRSNELQNDRRTPLAESVLSSGFPLPPHDDHPHRPAVEGALGRWRTTPSTAKTADSTAHTSPNRPTEGEGAECFVEDIFKARLMSEPTFLAHTKFEKLKLPIGVLLMPDADQVTAIATEFTRHTNADLGKGIGRFERLLEPVKLDGEVPREIKDAIYEAQQIRNVWAYRAGIADARFCDDCPKFPVSIGEKFLYRRRCSIN